MESLVGTTRTARLVLRHHRAEDEDALLRIRSRPDVARFLLEEPWTRADARTRVARRMTRLGLDGASESLALVIERDGAVIGDVSLQYLDAAHGIAEIGWVLDPEHSGHGYALEAAVALRDIAFDTYGVHRVEARMDARNEASARLARRLGLTQEAHLRHALWSKGEYVDTLVFGLLASEQPRDPSPERDSG